MAAEKSAQRAETLESTVAERMAMGMLLGAGPRDPTVERSLDERARGQIGIARRRPRPAA